MLISGQFAQSNKVQMHGVKYCRAKELATAVHAYAVHLQQKHAQNSVQNLGIKFILSILLYPFRQSALIFHT